MSGLLINLISCETSLLCHDGDTVLLANLGFGLLDGAHDVNMQGTLLFFGYDLGATADEFPNGLI